MAIEEEPLAELLSGEVRELLAEPSPHRSLARVVDLLERNVPRCDSAAITTIEDGTLHTLASTGTIAERLDRLQTQLGEGPLIDDLRTAETFLTGNVLAERRWPHFAARANREAGACSVVAVRLFLERDHHAAVALYSTRPDAFDDAAVATARILAALSAAATDGLRRERDLERKAASRDVIGRAKGILMAQQRIGDDAAFELLKAASQRRNRKLVDIATELTETGRLAPDR